MSDITFCCYPLADIRKDFKEKKKGKGCLILILIIIISIFILLASIINAL